MQILITIYLRFIKFNLVRFLEDNKNLINLIDNLN